MAIMDLTRKQLLLMVGGVWLIGLVAIAMVLRPWEPETVVVTHWGSGHVARPALLPQFAEEFNKANHRTASGKRIRVETYGMGSVEQVDDVISRVTRGVALNSKIPDPVIITPSAGHWLVALNFQAGQEIVDISASPVIARTWIGIVTYRDMAECLGWPAKEIGFADILALRADPRGWSAYPCAKAEWGQTPLVAYTDPQSSTTGRSVLFTLYAIAAGKPADQLTVADITNPRVMEYVKEFQNTVDHYMPGTLPLNAKIYQGPRFGHFFFLPEDNLVSLYQGEEQTVIGFETKREPISRPMVMIYPKEGSAQNSYQTAVVRGPWVTDEQREAAEMWISYLRVEAQQRVFIQEGFRPTTNMATGDPISARFGLDATKPTVRIDPDRIDAAVVQAVVKSWSDVKKPGVATFVVDASGSMSGQKLEQARQGVVRAIDGMEAKNYVGLVTFGDSIKGRVEVAPLADNRYQITDSVQKMRAGGQTALYDAVIEAIRMTDSAPGDPNSIRGVVVLTDGRANGGQHLDKLLQLQSREERPIRDCTGFENETACAEATGRRIDKRDIIGVRLAINTRYPIHIFFIGLGEDVDMEVGRMIAEATGSSHRGVTEKNLAEILAEYGKYF